MCAWEWGTRVSRTMSTHPYGSRISHDPWHPYDEQLVNSEFCWTHQSYSLQPLFESFLCFSFSENGLQPADELCCKPLRLYVDVLWHAISALEETHTHKKLISFRSEIMNLNHPTITRQSFFAFWIMNICCRFLKASDSCSILSISTKYSWRSPLALMLSRFN